MQYSPSVFRLLGCVQHYAWGGTSLLPSLLGMDNPDGQPFAEYWIGTHPKGPATVVLPDGEAHSLQAFLEASPSQLGQAVWDAFGGFPFLLKILDVKEMLSIQLHPERAAARIGYERENAAGIPLTADHRNYKDANHKPEVMVALTDFWLLHGFRTAAAIRDTLVQQPAWTSLLPVLDAAGVDGLYAHVMLLPHTEVNALLQPLYEQLAIQQATLHPDTADYWAWQAFEQYTRDGQHDRGIFSIYWFNIVFLRPGQGIFQGAGIPHAYLRGANVELMANSDNVLRGGLTPKHIDVPELLEHIVTQPVTPHVLSPQTADERLTHYPVPVPDFALSRLLLPPGDAYLLEADAFSILLILRGSLTIDNQIFRQGDAVFCPPHNPISLHNTGAEVAEVYRAFV